MRGLARLAVLLRDQWRDPCALERLRVRRLCSFVARAAAETPAVQERLALAGLDARDISTVADLARLPVVDKEWLAGLPRDRKLSTALDPSRLVKETTSGSTGLPLEVFLTRDDASWRGMAWVRAMLAHGMRPRDRRLEITGPHNLVARGRWYHRLGLWTWSGVSVMEEPEAWLRAWRRAVPDVLWGYTGSLHLLATHLLERGLEECRPRLVFGVSDSVDPAAREDIRAAFGTRLIDLYGTAEAGLVAWECPVCEGYHINSDMLAVEFLHDGVPVAPGEPGRVTVTSFFSRAMPVLRYDLGDLAVPVDAPQACGRGLPLLGEVRGRNEDRLVLPSGRLLSPMFGFGVMKPVAGVRRWRVLQDREGGLTVLLVPGPAFTGEGAARVRRRWEECLGEPLPVEVRLVDSIPPSRSGKLRSTISLCRPPGRKP